MSAQDDEDIGPINATFAFFDPTPDDEAGLAAFIPRYFPGDRHELAKLIAHQPRVGTTIKNQESDDELGQALYGFVTCLNLAFHAERPCVRSLLDWLFGLGDSGLCELLSTSLPTVGLLLSERAYGVPLELAPHLCRSIFSEIAWATEDLPTEEERAAFRFSHYILIKKAVRGEEGLEFPLIEDELFYKHASLKLEFMTDGEEGDLADLEYHRWVLVVDASAVPVVRQEIKEMFGVDDSQFADEGRV
jgi:protein BCP1